MTDQTTFLFEKDSELKRMQLERDEAIRNANEYRARVLTWLDSEEAESKHTQAVEESRGLEPVDREQYQRAIQEMRENFLRHDYLKECQTEAAIQMIEVKQ